MHAQEAIRLIRRQADRLRTLDAFDSRQPVFRRWFKETKAAFDQIFGAATGPNREFQEIIFQPITPSKSDPDSDWRQAYDRGVPVALAFFDSVIEDLTAHPDHVPMTAAAETPSESPSVRKTTPLGPDHVTTPSAAQSGTYVVVGGGDASRADVVGFLEKIGSRAAGLAADPAGDSSGALLERLDELSPLAFAVLLIAPDEPLTSVRPRAGRPAPRTGTNPSFALGVLLGRLGRKNVCVLHPEDAEPPAEAGGLARVPFDARGTWRFDLARAMKNAGLPVDLNNALL